MRMNKCTLNVASALRVHLKLLQIDHRDESGTPSGLAPNS
jgi:hypothetical protein